MREMLLRFLHFSYFCIRREETLSKTYLEFKEALCLSCGWEPRKFAIVHKDSIVVLTHIAWAAIVTSASMVSYDLQVKNVAYSSTLL